MAPKSVDIYSETPGQGKAGMENIVRCGALTLNQHIVDEYLFSHQIY